MSKGLEEEEEEKGKGSSATPSKTLIFSLFDVSRFNDSIRNHP